MPNIASILKEEIARVSRKEVRRDTAALKKASASYRSEIAALKRRTEELERLLRRAMKGMTGAAAASAPASAGSEADAVAGRFSGKSLASQRRRLGLSAAECGLLVGASGQSVYNWEDGKARPRAKNLPAIFALRKLGRKQAAAQLAALKQ